MTNADTGMTAAEKVVMGLDLQQAPDPSSGDGVARTFEQCQEWAYQAGCELRIATDYELFVDCDTDEAFEHFLRNFYYLHKKIQKCHFSWTLSKSGLPHRHVTVHLTEPLPVLARVALQACLGSDPLREMFSVERALKNEENVVIFFERAVK